MITLNLIDKDRSNISYHRFVFPDGQDHIRLIMVVPRDTPVKIVTRLANVSDLFILLQATEALNHIGVRDIDLEVTYLLAARMDRRMSIGEPNTLKLVAQLLNQQNYREVKIFDPHSEVSLTLIDRSSVLTETYTKFIKGVLDHIKGQPYLISPDAGAAKKTEKVGENSGLEVIYCTKLRSDYGYISKVKVGADDLSGKDCLIVDDICDGGATFIGLAQELKRHNAGKLYLAVSHGIFSKGFDSLTDFERIFTTNSYKTTYNEKLTIYNLW